MDQQNRTELEAAVLRRLLHHLDDRKALQNIDLMNLAGFCRNCLAKWYLAAAEEKGLDMNYEKAREISRAFFSPALDWGLTAAPDAGIEMVGL